MKKTTIGVLTASAVAMLAGTTHAQLAPLRISQVFGGGGSTGAVAFGRDYIELYNAGPTPIDLSRLSVQYASNTGTTWSQRALSGSVAPGSYYLVSLSTTQSPATSPALPGPDFTTATSLAISATAGKIAIVNGSTLLTGANPAGGPTVVDLVGYGTGTNGFEGAAQAGAPSIANAIFRTAPCDDLNQNGTDFSVAVAAPRWSGSGPGPVCTVPAGSDLQVSVTQSGACPFTVGDTLTYTFTVQNLGGSNATGVVLDVTLPTSNATFASSVPALVPSGGILTYNIGNLNVGASAVLTVSLNASAVGPLNPFSATATVASGEFASYNNSISTARGLIAAAPGPNSPRAIFNTRTGVASNLDPVNAPGVKLAGVVNRPIWSADGQRWAVVMDTDALGGTTTNDQALLVGAGLTWTAPVREGVTLMPTGNALFDFDTYVSLNNAGNFAFSGDDNTSTTVATIDKLVVKSVAGVLSTVALEGGTIPAGTGITGTWGTAGFGSVTIQNDDTVSFYAPMVGPIAANDTGVFKNDGNAKLAQEGIDIPTGQVDAGGVPTTVTYKAFDTGSSDATGFFVSDDAATWGVSGTINSVATTVDRVAVVNNAVTLQESIAVPGGGGLVAATPTPINFFYVDPAGDAYVYGSATGGADFASRNGTILAKKGDPIFTGSPILWDDAAFGQGFFMAVGNSNGDYVVGGLTTVTATDTSIDAMLVLNGTKIVAREGDPVDVNGDGLYNDDAFIRIFRNDYGTITNDGNLYFAVALQTGADRCAGNATSSGEALVRVRAICVADVDDGSGTGVRDEGVGIEDLLYYLALFEAGTAGADVDDGSGTGTKDGGVGIEDLLYYLSRFEAGC